MSFLSSPMFGSRVPALGDTASFANTTDDIKKLQQQINRYTLDGGAPVHLRIGTAPVPVTGQLDAATAQRVLWIMQLRAGMTQLEYNDLDTRKLVQESMQAWNDAVGFVQQHLQRCTQVLKLFGDLNKIPAAKGVFGVPGLTPTFVVAGLTAGFLGFTFLRGARRR